MENKEINGATEIAAEQTAVAVADENINESPEAIESTTEMAPVEENPAQENAAEETAEEVVLEEPTVEEVPVDVVDETAIQAAAEETEADKITVNPIGEAPEIEIKDPSVFKKAADFFTSVRWQRAWDKISVWLLILLFALPIGALVYILSYFF